MVKCKAGPTKAQRNTGKRTNVSDKINGRALARYKENAERLGIPLEDYLTKGQSGKRYCSRCLKWKMRSSFKEFHNTTTYYSGICKACAPGKTAHKSQNSVTWGPSLRASAKLGISIEVYLQKRSEGFRWCTDHKDWFDARDMLEGSNPSITRCKDCNKTRQADFRARKKISKKVKLKNSSMGGSDGDTQGKELYGETTKTENDC